MSPSISIPTVGALAFVLNVPLGVWRARCRRFSVSWFTAIHASVPFIAAARLLLDVPWPWIPLFVALAVAGQLIGGGRSPSRR